MRGLAVLALLLGALPAAAQPGDAHIRKEILGSWVVAAGSSDRTQASDYLMETFHPDGTYLFQAFRDPDCRQEKLRVALRWEIADGVLTSITPDGIALRDRVMTIGGGAMTLRSLDGGAPYTRRKSALCGRPRTS